LTEIISYSSFFQTKDYTTTACSETQNWSDHVSVGLRTLFFRKV
jgi:hypothetical protein